MNFNIIIKEPITATTVYSFLVILLTFLILIITKPKIISKVDAKGRRYIDYKIVFLYSLLTGSFAGICILLLNAENYTPILNNNNNNQKFLFVENSVPKANPTSRLY